MDTQDTRMTRGHGRVYDLPLGTVGARPGARASHLAPTVAETGPEALA